MIENNKKHHTVEELEHFKIWAHFMPKQSCKELLGMMCDPQIGIDFCWKCFNERKNGNKKKTI